MHLMRCNANCNASSPFSLNLPNHKPFPSLTSHKNLLFHISSFFPCIGITIINLKSFPSNFHAISFNSAQFFFLYLCFILPCAINILCVNSIWGVTLLHERSNLEVQLINNSIQFWVVIVVVLINGQLWFFTTSIWVSKPSSWSICTTTISISISTKPSLY